MRPRGQRRATASGCGRSRPASEIKSSPVVVGDAGADRLVRRPPLRARRARPASCAGRSQTDGLGARHAGGPGRPRLHRRLRRDASARSASPTARSCIRSTSGAYTGASPVDRRRPRVLRHLRQRGARARPRSAARCSGATRIPIGSFPFYSSAALADGRVIVGGRDKMVHAHRRGDRQGGVDVHDPRARRLVAGGRRRPRLRRLERRPALRARRGDAARSCGSSTPAPRSPRRPPSPPAASSSASQDGRIYVLG